MNDSAAVRSAVQGIETEHARVRRDAGTAGFRRPECLRYQGGISRRTHRAHRDVWAEVFAEARRRVPLPDWPAPEPMPVLGALVVLVTTAPRPSDLLD